MFEKHFEPLASLGTFLFRLLCSLVIGIVIIAITLLIGMVGFRYFEDMSWVNSYMNAAMTLSDMGLVNPITTNSGKIFTGLYALFCGLIFITALSVVFAPIIHRFFHAFHHNGKK
jgi:hypothetical protein